MEEPGEGDLHGGGVEVGGYFVEHGGLQRGEAAQREVGDVGDSLPGERVDEGVVRAVGNVVGVLDADDLGHGLGFGELLSVDRGEANVADEALLLELDEDFDLFGDGAGGWLVDGAHAEVDDVEGFEAEVFEVVVDALDEGGAGTVLDPGAVCAAGGSELGDEGEMRRVRVQGFLDDLVGDVRAVEV